MFINATERKINAIVKSTSILGFFYLSVRNLFKKAKFHGKAVIFIDEIDAISEALLRPGRFDRHIEVSLPDVNIRERILLYIKKRNSI